MIREDELARIVAGILEDKEIILKHNPIGTPAETLLWMLLSCLVGYLSLSDIETPCFSGRPDDKAYRDAIEFILRDRKADEFDPTVYLDKLSGQ